MNGIEGFREAIRSAGLEPPATIEADGKLRRFPSNGKRGDDAGWYVLHDDGIPAGSFGDWRSGITQTWHAEIGRKLTPAEEAAHRAKIDRQRRAREAEEKRRGAEARWQAAEIWSKAQPAPIDHPYLQRKGVHVHGLRVYRGDLIISGMPCDGCLVIPVRDINGTPQSLEFVSAENSEDSKRFLPGGRVQGCYYSIGKPKGVLCVVEGFATGASIYEATGHAVAVAFHSGNLLPVAQVLKERFLDAELILCADDDHRTAGNPGLTKAREAARAVGGRVAVPEFGTDRPNGATDFNDLHVAQGLDAVRACIDSALTEQSQRADSVGVLSVLSVDAWPEPRPIKSELYAVDPMRRELIPEPYRDWLADIAERMQCPLDFVAVTAIVMTGTVIGAGCGIKPKREDDWLVIPNLWGGVIGHPSRLKSPSISEAMNPLSMLERRANKEHDDAESERDAEIAAYEARKSALKDSMRKNASKPDELEKTKREYAALAEPNPPGWTRYRTNDATIEKMSELLRDNPRGLLLFRDELIGLLATWDKEGHESDRAFFLEAWNGYGSHTTDRIGRGTIHTENLCASVFGGIQPGKLTGYLYRAMRGHDNDGLLQRIQLLVFPDDPSGWKLVDRKPNEKAKSRAFDVLKRLAEMKFTEHGATQGEHDKTPWVRFDAEAQLLFYDWWTELEQTKLRGDDTRESIMLEHLGKYRKAMPALAEIFHWIDVADGHPAGPVSLRAARLAAAWCEYLESHAKRIYGLVSNIAPRAAANLIERIRKGSLADTFTTRDVYRKQWELLQDRDTVEEACLLLAANGWLRDVTPQSDIGRPQATTYLINPKAIKGGGNG